MKIVPGRAPEPRLRAERVDTATDREPPQVVPSDSVLRDLLAASEERYRLVLERSPDVIFQYSLQPEPRFAYMSPSVQAMTGYPAAAFYANPGLVMELAHPDDRAIVARLLSGEADPAIAPRLRWIRADGEVIWTEQRISRLERGGQLVEIDGTARNVTAQVEAEAALARMAVVVENAAESVVMTDLGGRITYVNPAFERTSGYSRSEVIGQNPRVLRSGTQSATFYEAMWASLTNGLPWVADFVNRRKDGSLYAEHSVLWPITDAAGAVTGYGAIKRELTRERELEVKATRAAHERAVIGETIRGLESDATVEATARALCRQVASLSGIDGAALYIFEADGRATPLAIAVPGQPDPPLESLSIARSRAIETRAADGPWNELSTRRSGHVSVRSFAGRGPVDVGYAPIRHGAALLGVLMMLATSRPGRTPVVEALPALAEFADLAGAVVAKAVADRAASASQRARVAGIIATSAFHPQFQPIVDLASGEFVGYEALTRFSSLARPDLVFGEARSCGLESDLEIATLSAAIDAAAELPSPAWLSLNVSPDLVTGDPRLADLLRRAGRPVVLEVTEHVQIADYAALRSSIRDLQPPVRVAVDDAGAGVANFSHIVDLKPAFVKLDIGLVRGIDDDPTRRALIVGLLHFARESAGQAIAEGIETDAELATLQGLGTELGQGYLLGRPAPAAHWAAMAAATVATTARAHAGVERDVIAGARNDATGERASIADARRGATARRDAISRQRIRAAVGRDGLAALRDKSEAARDTIADARDVAATERDAIATVRDDAAAERDTIAAERDQTARRRDDIAGARDELAKEHAVGEQGWQPPAGERRRGTRRGSGGKRVGPGPSP